MAMQTPMRTVRGLGSTRSGTEHFWRQRLTGAALVPLTIAFVIVVACLFGRSYEDARAILASPFVAVVLLLLIGSVAVHMRIGMQVVIEDYVHGEGLKVVLLAANTFFTVVIGVASAVAVLKLAFGG
jgi:succinate dehydrogenase / fumarate reductase membrane anchor subunit